MIKSLSRSHLGLPPNKIIDVELLEEDNFKSFYTISIPDGHNPCFPQYIFHAVGPAEPFYKTASEVATLSYLRENTSIPVPRVIAHSPTAENELGCEWILMENIPGIALADVWNSINLETKTNVIKDLAGFARQLRDPKQHHDTIGNIYFREDISDEEHTSPVGDGKYVIGPIVTSLVLIDRKLGGSRDNWTFTNEKDYVAFMTTLRMELLGKSADVGDIRDAENIIKWVNEPQPTSAETFPSPSDFFLLLHEDLSLDNIIIHPGTHKIEGIINWAGAGSRPHWEDPYPEFLEGPEVEGEVEPPSPEDTDKLARREDWEKMKLRLVFDHECGGLNFKVEQ